MIFVWRGCVIFCVERLRDFSHSLKRWHDFFVWRGCMIFCVWRGCMIFFVWRGFMIFLLRFLDFFWREVT